jgi:RNA polymerase sigma factor (sigma-70 family)
MKAAWLRTALGRFSWGTDEPTEGDGSLLARFAATGDDGAFAALVQRHGAMVRGVCLRVLNNGADADDAFQATFLVLARRAARLGSGSVRNWLWGVAYRVACRARATSARRRHHEERAGRPQAEAVSFPEVGAEWAEVRLLLDAELARLPSRYRLPLLLCYLEGKSQSEVAGELGWPEGSVAGRLSRARDLLRRRLVARGWTLPATVPVVWAVLPGHAARAAVAVVSDQVLPPAVVALCEGALLAMWIAKLKLLVLSVAAAGVLVGALVWAQSSTVPTSGATLALVPGSGDTPQPKGETDKKAEPEKNAEAEEVVAQTDPTQALSRRIKFPGVNDPQQTLDDTLKLLKHRYGLNYEINIRAFKSDMLNDPDKFQVAATGEIPPIQGTLDAVLKSILARVPAPSGATFLVRGDGIEITTGAAVKAEVWGPDFDGPFLPLVHLKAKKVPLNEALDQLADQGRLNIVYMAGAEKAATPVTARLTNVPVDTAVRVLAAQAGLSVVQRDNVFLVTTPDQAAAMTKEFQAETSADPMIDARKWRRGSSQPLVMDPPGM